MKIKELMQMSSQHSRPFVSLEFFPPKEQTQWPSFFESVDKLATLKPLFTSVTYGAGGSSQENTLELTAQLKARGHEPMAHLTCVGAGREQIGSFLQQLRALGVDNVLALRGDPPKSHDLSLFNWEDSEFRYAEDLVRHIRRVQPDMGVAVAGYPAPHPESPSFIADRRHTRAKIRAGADFVVTQLFFDVREYFDLVDDLRNAQVNVPVIPGILPIQSFDSLRRVLSLCGANIPGKLYLELEEAHNKGGREAVRDVGINFAVSQIRHLIEGGAPGIHLYTLNQAQMCLRLMDSALAGY